MKKLTDGRQVMAIPGSGELKRGYEKTKDRKLLEIWKKDRTWLKYEYMSKRWPHFFSK